MREYIGWVHVRFTFLYFIMVRLGMICSLCLGREGAANGVASVASVCQVFMPGVYASLVGGGYEEKTLHIIHVGI
jgi:hypothetical protein